MLKKTPVPKEKRKTESANTQPSQKVFLIGLEDFEQHEIQEIYNLEVNRKLNMNELKLFRSIINSKLI